MSRAVVCPQGHHWETPGEGAPEVCPVCGGSATVLGWTAQNAAPSSRPATLPGAWTPMGPPPSTIPAPANSADPALSTPPDYEILSELGRGGMGVVYKARHLKLNRVVAIKMLTAGAHAGSELLLRFRREAESFARLTHPNIVQIHEVGSLGTHGPFLVLEYVEGGSLSQKLGRKPQPPRQAAELVAVLARAVHFAHEHGVLHRDLKPSNVLLTLGGAPKVADFGLARFLEDEAASAPDQPTPTGAVLGTPSYMAPEQASGVTRAPTTAMDTYALGAILYEMLTGRPPFLAAGPMETMLLVMEKEPVPPRRLQVKVPRDLETICLHCLRKNPRQRYSSAAALADDLQRFLDGRPVQARPVGPAERLVKWARRRPLAAALVAVLAAVLLVGLGGVLWYNAHLRAERDRAEANYQLALKAVDELLTEVGDEQLEYEPHMEQKRRALLKTALAFSERLLEEKGDEPELRLRVALAHKRVGDIHRLLREHKEARQAYLDASVMLERLHAERPANPEYRQDLAACDNWLGETLRIDGRLADAEDAYRKAVPLEEGLCKEFPDDAAYRRDLAQTRYNLGLLCTQTDRLAEAEESFDSAVGLLQPLVDAGGAEAADRHHLARALLDRGPVLRATNRLDRAEADYRRAIALLTALVQADPDNTNYRYEKGVALNNLGNLLAKEDHWDGARTAHSDALALLTVLARDFPRTPVFREELANTFNSYGKALAKTSEPDAADKAWVEARQQLERLIAEQQGDTATYRGYLGLTVGNQGWSLAKREKWQEARPLLEQAVADLVAARQAQPRNPLFRDGLAEHERSLAETLLNLKDHAAAAEAARAIPALFPGSGKDEYLAACFLARCAATAADDERLPEAERRRLSRSYADESLQRLKDAARDGFSMQELRKPDQAEIFRALQNDPAFQALTPRP